MSAREKPRKYDVKAYGAKGDGVTDDTAAIQRAVNTAYAEFGPAAPTPTDPTP